MEVYDNPTHWAAPRRYLFPEEEEDSKNVSRFRPQRGLSYIALDRAGCSPLIVLLKVWSRYSRKPRTP
jgi:hypothetical protein